MKFELIKNNPSESFRTKEHYRVGITFSYKNVYFDDYDYDHRGFGNLDFREMPLLLVFYQTQGTGNITFCLQWGYDVIESGDVKIPENCTAITNERTLNLTWPHHLNGEIVLKVTATDGLSTVSAIKVKFKVN